jgi:hypothetical protein
LLTQLGKAVKQILRAMKLFGEKHLGGQTNRYAEDKLFKAGFSALRSGAEN